MTKQFRIPQSLSAVAAAGEKAADKAKARTRSLAEFTPDDFVVNDPEEEVVKGNQNGSAAWLHSPGHLELFRAADQRLTKVAEKRGQEVKRVEKVRAARIKGKKLIFIWPAEPDDMSAIEVNRYESSSWINLITLLSAAKLTVPTGFRERYSVEYAPADCAMAPCLMLDLGKPLERRTEPGRKKAEDGGEIAATATRSRKQQSQPAAQAPAAPTPTPETTEDKQSTPQIEFYDPTAKKQ